MLQPSAARQEARTPEGHAYYYNLRTGHTDGATYEVSVRNLLYVQVLLACVGRR